MSLVINIDENGWGCRNQNVHIGYGLHGNVVQEGRTFYLKSPSISGWAMKKQKSMKYRSHWSEYLSKNWQLTRTRSRFHMGLKLLSRYRMKSWTRMKNPGDAWNKLHVPTIRQHVQQCKQLLHHVSRKWSKCYEYISDFLFYMETYMARVTSTTIVLPFLMSFDQVNLWSIVKFIF